MPHTFYSVEYLTRMVDELVFLMFSALRAEWRRSTRFRKLQLGVKNRITVIPKFPAKENLGWGEAQYESGISRSRLRPSIA